MTVRKKFNLNFGIEDSVEDERRKFVRRTNQTIFHEIDTNRCRTFAYEELFERLCFEMGFDASDMREKYGRKSDNLLVDEEHAPEIRCLTDDSFENTLFALCILYKCFEDSQDKQRGFSDMIETILSSATRDIGVRWENGFFYPSGAKELDESLIDETMTWLNEYPNEKKNYQAALRHYQEKKASGDVITNCYSAIEGITRNVLGNDKTLDNNKNDLLAKIKLSEGWKTILANYITYAHNFRHASEQRHSITKQETEAYLYMTGLIIRLIIESK